MLEQLKLMFIRKRSYTKVMDCGHPENFLIGDDWGNFTCVVCQRDKLEAALRESLESTKSLIRTMRAAGLHSVDIDEVVRNVAKQ